MSGGWALTIVGATGSTNTDMVAAAEAGAAEGTALLALAQRQGRGRAGRAWESPPGNLALSVVLRPDIPVARAGELGLVAALAVADLLQGLGLAPRLKWPNDVLLEEAKLAGVLVETALRADRLAWAVVGIGLNVAHHPRETPYPATALAAHLAAPPAVPALGEALLAALAARHAAWTQAGFAPIRAAWQALGPAPGDPARVRMGSGLLTGRFHELDPEGGLVLETAPGMLQRINAGEVLAG